VVLPEKIIWLAAGALLITSLQIIPLRQRQIIDPGEQLARQYCSTCHQFPDPDILTKRSWNYLLTDMGFRLGIIDYSPISSISPEALMHMTTREKILHEANAIPGQPLLTREDWHTIRDYYSKSAPSQPLKQPKKPGSGGKLAGFELKTPAFQPQAAVFTLTRIDRLHGGLWLGNQKDQTLTRLDRDLKVTGRYQVDQVMVDLHQEDQAIYFLSIGDLMGRFIGLGKGIVHQKDPARINFYRQDHLISELHRPADMEVADLDLDGNNEFIISNFGDVTGNISIFDHDGNFLKELINAPGAIRCQVNDFNQDGLPDIAALLGDARENISIFFNQGPPHFERKVVVECHSAYGHTYFELQDFNGDGHMDFLTANGDTDADPFNTLKWYHGVRIYLNDGHHNFEPAYFYPMYGAHFAKAADFDQDGDLDIAASAFFPDFSSDRPEQFIYLENQGNLQFRPATHPETYQGRWMTLDVGDYDLDGDQDIVLGGGYLPLGMVVDYRDKYEYLVNNGKAVLIFENNLY